MTATMAEKSCTQFAADLAAKRSVPGGGAAAACAGALAAALASMVGNFTVGKERYAEHEADVQRLLAESERIRVRLLELMDEDAHAFEPLAAAYAIPKDAPERAATVEAATKGALEAPLEMMRQVAAAISVLEELRTKGSRMLLSDVGCGAALAAGALRAASLNVFVNTKALQDRACADTANAEAEALLAAAAQADETFAAVTDAERGAQGARNAKGGLRG